MEYNILIIKILIRLKIKHMNQKLIITQQN